MDGICEMVWIMLADIILTILGSGANGRLSLATLTVPQFLRWTLVLRSARINRNNQCDMAC